MPCEAHNYQHSKTDSYYYSSGRYSLTYVETIHLFCTHCGEPKEVTRKAFINHGEQYKLPDWAKSITQRNSHLDND